jgi:hypothetical protein
MIPLSMVMRDVFAKRSPQGALTKEDHLGQTFLLHRPHPFTRDSPEAVPHPSMVAFLAICCIHRSSGYLPHAQRTGR